MPLDEHKEVTYDPLIELMKRFENVKAVDTSADPFEGLTVEDCLKKHIVDGVKAILAGSTKIYVPVHELSV